MTEERRQFEWTVMRHLDAAYNVARWYLRNDSDAEDVVQDAVLSAYKSFSKFKGVDGKPWLLKIVRNHCLRHLEKERRFSVLALDQGVEGSHEVADPDDPESLFLRAADADGLDAALSKLPEIFREVIVLREFEDLTYAEISGIVEIPVGTVMSRLSRARSCLASELRRIVAEELS